MTGSDAIEEDLELVPWLGGNNGVMGALDMRWGSRKGMGKVGIMRCARGCGEWVRLVSSRSRKRLFRHVAVGVEKADGEPGMDEDGDMSMSIMPSSSFV